VTNAIYNKVFAILAISNKPISSLSGNSCNYRGSKAGAVPMHRPSMATRISSKNPNTCVEKITKTTIAKFLVSSPGLKEQVYAYLSAMPSLYFFKILTKKIAQLAF
tara:strand:+ start:5671 stop:5988 length:318 start_codon:yes stop_codon:yes gene_type:complete